MQLRRSRVLAIAMTLWLMAVLGIFYFVQRPFGPAQIAALASTAINAVTCAIVVVLGAAAGRRLLSWLRAETTTAESLLLGTGIGLGVFAMAWLLIGLAGGLTPATAWILTLIAAVALWRDLFAVIRIAADWRPRIELGRGASLYLVVTLILTLLVALTPPISWDSLSYHLTGPQLHIEAGRIQPVWPEVPHFNFPWLMEALFTYASLLFPQAGGVSAQLLHLTYGLLLAGLVFLFARRYQAPGRDRLALLIFAAMPMVSVLAAWAYNDLALAFYQFAAIYALVRWRSGATPPQRFHWLIVAGVMCGSSLGLKYTAFVTPLMCGVLLVWWWVTDRWTARRALAVLFGFGSIAIVVAAPWYLKNLAFTGNPIYPFVFGGTAWDAFRNEWWSRPGSGIGLNPIDVLGLPVTVTLGLRDINYFDGRTGPLFLALLPALIVLPFTRRARSPGPLGALGVFVMAQIGVWVAGVIVSGPLWQSRLLLPALVGLSPLAAEAIASLRGLTLGRFGVRRFCNLTIGLVLILDVVYQGLYVAVVSPLAVISGLESRDHFLQRMIPGDHYAAMTALDQLPADARVLFLWEARSYYAPRPAQPDTLLDAWPHLVYRFGQPEAIATYLRDERFTHVLIAQAQLDFLVSATDREHPIDPTTLDALRAFTACCLQELPLPTSAYRLYALRSKS